MLESVQTPSYLVCLSVSSSTVVNLLYVYSPAIHALSAVRGSKQASSAGSSKPPD